MSWILKLLKWFFCKFRKLTEVIGTVWSEKCNSNIKSCWEMFGFGWLLRIQWRTKRAISNISIYFNNHALKYQPVGQSTSVVHISGTFAWITIKFCADIYVTQRITLKDFDGSKTFLLATLHGGYFWFWVLRIQKTCPEVWY